MKDNKSSVDASNSSSIESTRRDFIRKYGKLAAITPIAVTTLMSPSTSAAPKSCRGNGNKRC
ncbi:hypothetical protein HII17_18775 [Thalassotalea sp. M1531]|uniref:Uncharacterized protein n=1 Tax=Thalassotalea algicola TaxID=2716224 RepID=A0A7Y0LFM4_9GAMM|nr:hypothetical protein [Thalassotalea algicola]NMP33594.1 hypothetical protein [Thalassotalea algicola]